MGAGEFVQSYPHLGEYPGGISRGSGAAGGGPAPAAPPPPAAPRLLEHMAARLRQLRSDYGTCYGLGAAMLGDAECWTGLRRDAREDEDGTIRAGYLTAGSQGRLLALIRDEHARNPVPFGARLEYRDDLLERLAARRPGWALVRLPDSRVLGQCGVISAGPCMQASMDAQIGQALADTALAAARSHP